MHGRRSLLPNLEPIDRELEKTLRTHRQVKNKIDLQPQERPFKDYFSPLANLSTSCIRYPNVAARSFELNPSVLNCFPTFYGLENEDPYNHSNDFHAICQTFKYENFSNNDVKLRLFPFSLKNRACLWLNTLLANIITVVQILLNSQVHESIVE